MNPRVLELTLRMEHQHSDGSWGRYEPRQHHDAADHDPEREWGKATTYVCTSCHDEIIVSTEEAPLDRGEA